MHQETNAVTLENRAACASPSNKKRAASPAWSITSSRTSTLIAPGACGNQLQFFKDTVKEYDAWNIDPGTLDAEPSTIDKADSVEVDRSEPTHPRHPHHDHRQNSKFVQTITPSRLIPTRSTSRTTSTGTSPTSCSRLPSPSPPTGRLPPTRSPTAPSTGPPPATTRGRRPSSRSPPCAGPTFLERQGATAYTA
jgi:hypothetical protein